jgi:hypothetical protein
MQDGLLLFYKNIEPFAEIRYIVANDVTACYMLWRDRIWILTKPRSNAPIPINLQLFALTCGTLSATGLNGPKKI